MYASHNHVFLFLNSEALSEYLHVVTAFDRSRDYSAKGIKLSCLLIVNQLDNVDAQWAFRVAFRKLIRLRFVIIRVAIVVLNFSARSFMGRAETRGNGINETADTTEKAS